MGLDRLKDFFFLPNLSIDELVKHISFMKRLEVQISTLTLALIKKKKKSNKVLIDPI